MYEFGRVTNKEEWDDLVLENNGHPLQLWGWGEAKAKSNWNVDRIVLKGIRKKQIIFGAQILYRKVPFFNNKHLVYIPRGPFMSETEDQMELMDAFADYIYREYKAIAIQIEPDLDRVDLSYNWSKIQSGSLMNQTLILDLGMSEKGLLSEMAKKTRQYIRKAEKNGVSIVRAKTSKDINACLDIYKDTAKRAGFKIHEDKYYYDIFKYLGEASPVYMAIYEGKPVAFLWLAISNYTAFELYGGVTSVGQKQKANYSLKWKAITTCKDWGIVRYDMNGLVSEGVSNFKEGFSNHVNMLAGTYEYGKGFSYLLFSKLFPLGKRLIKFVKLNKGSKVVAKKEIENKEEKPMSFSPEEQKMEQTVSDLEKTIDDRKTEEVEEIKDEAKTAIEKD